MFPMYGKRELIDACMAYCLFFHAGFYYADEVVKELVAFLLKEVYNQYDLRSIAWFIRQQFLCFVPHESA
jgi:hypothetical protein